MSKDKEDYESSDFRVGYDPECSSVYYSVMSQQPLEGQHQAVALATSNLLQDMVCDATIHLVYTISNLSLKTLFWKLSKGSTERK